MNLTADPSLLKEYIDWVYDNKVVKAKRKLTSISFMTNEGIVNEYFVAGGEEFAHDKVTDKSCSTGNDSSFLHDSDLPIRVLVLRRSAVTNFTGNEVIQFGSNCLT